MKKTIVVLVLVLDVLAWATEPNEVEKLRAENAQLKQDTVRLGKQIQLLTTENETLKLKLGELVSQPAEANQIQKVPDTTSALKGKILAVHQKRNRLADLCVELKTIPPTVQVSMGRTVTTTKTTNTNRRGTRTSGDAYSSYRDNPPVEQTNPLYTQQKTKIMAIQNSIDQLEKEILHMNELRVKKGQSPIPIER